MAIEGDGEESAEEQRLRERFRHLDTSHPFVRELLAQCLLRVERRGD